jgi:FimV-like protein
VPSLLIELDDQVAAQRAPRAAGAPGMSRATTATRATDHDNLEEESFMMNLDLARAYLEIGDHDGARDMLVQALDETTDIGRRQQLEELLRQLDGTDRTT